MIHRARRANLALMLLFCILLAGFDCSLRHGDNSGMHLQTVGVPFCGATSPFSPLTDPGHTHGGAAQAPAEFGCLLVSSFVAVALAAFFALLGLLPGITGGRPPAGLFRMRPALARRPPAAPRAPPLFA